MYALALADDGIERAVAAGAALALAHSRSPTSPRLKG